MQRTHIRRRGEKHCPIGGNIVNRLCYVAILESGFIKIYIVINNNIALERVPQLFYVVGKAGLPAYRSRGKKKLGLGSYIMH